jgi:hypothetical protein
LRACQTWKNQYADDSQDGGCHELSDNQSHDGLLLEMRANGAGKSGTSVNAYALDLLQAVSPAS